MPLTSYKSVVEAPSPLLRKVKLVQRSDYFGIGRIMPVADGGAEKVIHELISLDERTKTR